MESKKKKKKENNKCIMNKGTGKFGIRRSKENHVFNKQNKQKNM